MADFYKRVEKIVNQIADGIDAAADDGVHCGYPAFVTIDGVRYSFDYWCARARTAEDIFDTSSGARDE
jgi:hypothetical protein